MYDKTYQKITMRKIVTLLFILITIIAAAQENAQHNDGVYGNEPQQKAILSSPENTNTELSAGTLFNPYLPTDTLHLPLLTDRGTMPSMHYWPMAWNGWHTWQLHKGLNASLGASVFSTFGSGKTYSGAGFGQNVALMYAMPLTNKLSLAVGGYFNNLIWDHSTYRDAGLTGILGYQFDEHWSAYLYGQKSIMDQRNMPYTLMDMSDLGDRIGAAVRYNFTPSFSVQISVETGRRANDYTPYTKSHNYDTPTH